MTFPCCMYLCYELLYLPSGSCCCNIQSVLKQAKGISHKIMNISIVKTVSIAVCGVLHGAHRPLMLPKLKKAAKKTKKNSKHKNFIWSRHEEADILSSGIKSVTERYTVSMDITLSLHYVIPVIPFGLCLLVKITEEVCALKQLLHLDIRDTEPASN